MKLFYGHKPFRIRPVTTSLRFITFHPLSSANKKFNNCYQSLGIYSLRFLCSTLQEAAVCGKYARVLLMYLSGVYYYYERGIYYSE